MSKRFDLITQQLLGKDLIDCSAEELQSLTEQYPYFSAAQFALLKKLQQLNSPDYKTQVQKAILYYHNPFAFDVFMNEEKYEVDFGTTITEETNTEAPAIIEESPAGTNEELTIENAFENEVATNSEPDLATIPELSVEQEAETTQEPVEFTEPLAHQQPTEDEQIASEIIHQPVTESQTTEVPNPETQLSKPEVDSRKPDESPLAFEPYHTVDYFASQGIKLSQEEATKDRFGKQLKSFTEWLKTMKRLPVAEQHNLGDATSEKKVESMAAHSVENSEVVTETMAEVWAKQGNREKALEIYQQLSLLNPSKKAYFAAKIDSLK